MTVFARRIVAGPSRSASEAWLVIVDLLAPDVESEARRELLGIAGIASALIADEAMTSPIVVYGSGPRLRIYCLYGEDAIAGDAANESALAFAATAGEWRMSLPCPADDLQWVGAALKKRSGHFTVRDLVTGVEVEETAAARQRFPQPEAAVDREAFFRP